jgi:hypothetical protein
MQLASRILAGLMALLFLASAGLQYNDPDPVIWIALYGAASAVCLAHVMQRSNRPLAILLGVISFVWAATLLPDFVGMVHGPDLVRGMEADRPEIEAAREAGGLLIVVVTMLFVAVVPKETPKDAGYSNPGQGGGVF